MTAERELRIENPTLRLLSGGVRRSIAAALACFLAAGPAFADEAVHSVSQTQNMVSLVYRDVIEIPAVHLDDLGDEPSVSLLTLAEGEEQESAIGFREENLPEDSGPSEFSGPLPLYVDAELELLRNSRERFRELFAFSADDGLEGIEQRFAGSLKRDEDEVWLDPNFMQPEGHDSYAPVSAHQLDSTRTYTVVNGRIVEVDPENYTDQSDDANILAFVEEDQYFGPEDEELQEPSRRVPSWTESTGASLADDVHFAAEPQFGMQSKIPSLLRDDDLSFGEFVAMQSPFALTQAFAESSAVKSVVRLEGSYFDETKGRASAGSLTGRVDLPRGVAHTKVFVRIGGTSLEVSPDPEGFFEIGPLPFGSSFELLVFDREGQLIPQSLPVFLTRDAPIMEISAIRPVEVLNIAQAFGTQQDRALSGFCGAVVDASPEVFLNLVDGSGVSHRLFYFSPVGLPSATAERLSENGRFCAFNLPAGSYHLEVRTPRGRQNFPLNLRSWSFRQGLVFDPSAQGHVKLRPLALFDQEVIGQSFGSGDFSVSLKSVFQNFWLTRGGSPVWAAVKDFVFRSTTEYSGIEYRSPAQRNYVPLGSEYVKMAAESEGSYELVGAGELRAAAQSGQELAFRILGRDATKDLRNALDDGVVQALSESSTFVYGEIDLARLGAEVQDVDLSIFENWTCRKTGTLRVLDEWTTPHKVRFVGAVDAKSLTSVVLKSRDGRILWTTFIAPQPGETQLISNLPRH